MIKKKILSLKEKELSKILSDFLISWSESKFSMFSMIQMKMKNTKESAKKKTNILENDLNDSKILYRDSSFQIKNKQRI